MKTCPPFARVISEIAGRHGLDLSKVGSALRLDQPNYDRLCIEVIGERLVSVAHYFEQHGDLVADPEMVWYVYPDYQWVPVSIRLAFGGRERTASLVRDGRIVNFWPAQQADQASFARVWARNLRQQGWLKVKTPTRITAA